MATFSLDPAVLSSVVTKQWDGLTLESLQVGALVQARITNVLKVRLHPHCLRRNSCFRQTCFIYLSVRHDTPIGPQLSYLRGVVVLSSALNPLLISLGCPDVMAQDGLVVAFLTFFSGTIDKFHLTQQLAAEDWATKYSAGQKLLARILFVDPLTKRVGLTLAKHLLEQVLALHLTLHPRLSQRNQRLLCTPLWWWMAILLGGSMLVLSHACPDPCSL